MYIIVNYDRWWKYPQTLDNFNSAFMLHQLIGDENNIIEYYNKNYEREVVWSKKMEE